MFNFLSCLEFVESLQTVSKETLLIMTEPGGLLESAENWAKENRNYWSALADRILRTASAVRHRLD